MTDNPDTHDVEALARELCTWHDTAVVPCWHCKAEARHVLDSDWLAARDAKVRAEALREAADEIEQELVCCDAFEKRDVRTSHHICYWGGAATTLVRDRAERIEGGAS